ncbi:hypothetical protein BGZ46_004527 [Entomortierella lignicola]|nr:hypothetical protein BGZ46_004527 [Entomortierella lignicola]
MSASTTSISDSEQQSQHMSSIEDDFSFVLNQGYNNHNLYQHPLSPASSSSSSPPAIQADGHEDEEALKMDLFPSHCFDFDLNSNSSSIGNLPSPCSPTFDSFQVDTPNTESDINPSRLSVSARPKPLDLNASKTTDANTDPYLDSNPTTAMSMVTTTDSPAPTRPSSPSPSFPSEPTSPSFDDTMIPVVACGNCKKSHIKCDHGRPCLNCSKHPNKVLSCRDAIPKQRGRPKNLNKSISEPLPYRFQHSGFQPFSSGPFISIHGQPEQCSHPYRQRAMSYPHLSMQQQQEMLLQQHEHYHIPSPEYHHSLAMSSWANGTAGVPEMQAIPTPTGPQSSVPMMPAVGYVPAGMDAHEYQKFQQHRQQAQQHLQQQAKAPEPHDVGMSRSMSEQYAPHRAPLRHFHSEHHQLLHMQQQQHQRQRSHPGHSLTLMIPNTVDGRLVATSGASSAYPGSLPPTPISPVHPLHSPTQPYHHHHSLHPIHLAQPPLSPISHGPVGHDDATSMALLLQQEQEIKQDLEMFEQQGLQKQQELARISMQRLKLQQQQTMEHLSHLQQQQIALQQEQQQQHSRLRFRRRPSLPIGMSSLQLSSGAAGALAPLHDEEMAEMDA